MGTLFNLWILHAMFFSNAICAVHVVDVLPYFPAAL